jgi:glycosyltransferase involved in cell wall biosynthesis
MKIAIISTLMFDDSVGGVENHIRFMAREFISQGHEITIFKPVWTEKFDVHIRAVDNIPVTLINIGKRVYSFNRWSGEGVLGLLAGFLEKAQYMVGRKKVVQTISNWNPDLIWQHDLSSSWLATKILSKRFPVVLTNHTGEYLFFKKIFGGELLLSQLLKHYRAVIGPSKELTPSFIKNSYTIHNGVDLSAFKPVAPSLKSGLREKLFGDTEKFVVFCPRRWAPTKGIIFLARAMKWISGNYSQASKFLIVFAGSKDPQYPKYVDSVNEVLNQQNIPVLNLGNMDPYDLIPYYQAANLVVIPSLMEAVSLAALESMACGVPVLSSRVGGMPEIIEHEKTGYFVEPEQPIPLAELLIKLFESQSMDNVVNGSLRLVRSKHDWSEIAKETEKILIEVYENSRSFRAANKSDEKKLAILYDCPYPFVQGGGQKRLYEVGRALINQGWKVDWYPLKFWEGEPNLNCGGIMYRSIGNRKQLYRKDGKRSILEALYYGKQVALNVNLKQYDVILAGQWPFFHLFPAFWAQLKKGPKVVVDWWEVWSLHWFEYFGKIGLAGFLIERLFCRLFNHIIALSEKEKQQLIGIGVRGHAVTVIPNGLDLNKIQLAKKNKNIFDLVYLGRLNEHKNVGDILVAVSILKKEGHKFSLQIIGEGPHREALENQTKYLNIMDLVTFYSMIASDEEVYGRMKSSCLFIYPSIQGTGSITILEANACGLPVLAYKDIQGLDDELIQEGNNGFWISQTGPEGLAQKIKDVLAPASNTSEPGASKTTASFNSHQKVKQKLKETAMQYAEDYDWSVIGKCYDKYFESILKK